jgi:hypothetical protein
MSPSGERGTLTVSRFVQQSRVMVKTTLVPKMYRIRT